MIGDLVIPTFVDFSKRHEPTGALVGRRVTGEDSAIAKADQPRPSVGRQAAGTSFGAVHGLVAGRKGKKLKAAGTSYGYSLGGYLAGGAAGLLATRRVPEARILGLAAGASGGSLAGAHHAVMRNQAAGRYMPENKVGKAAATPRILRPLLGTGPVKKAPTMARTGGVGQPKHGLLVPSAHIGQPIRKALGPQTLEAAFHDMRGQRNALATAHERKGSRPHSPQRRVGRRRLVATGAGGVLAGAAGDRAVRKAYRSYDPEDARQRRLGAMASASALGGGALVATGGREIARDTKGMRRSVLEARQNGMRETASQSSFGRAVRDAGKIPAEGAALLRVKPSAKVAGGAALLAGAGRLMSDRHKKPWK